MRVPRRWESELSKVPTLAEPDRLWQASRERATRGLEPVPPDRRQRLLAGIVAITVFAAATLFSWAILTRTSGDPQIEDDVGSTETVAPAPTSASLALTRPSPDAEFPVPTGTLRYGEFSEELMTTGTSYMKPFASVSMLPVSHLGFPAGLPIGMASPAEAATAAIRISLDDGVEPIASYDLTEEMIRLPEQPGFYYLTVRARWHDGTGTFLLGIPVLRPGTLQLALEDHGRNGEATAELWLDGRHFDASVVQRSQTEGGSSEDGSDPTGGPHEPAFIPIEAGADLRFVSDMPTELAATLTGPAWADASDSGVVLSLFGPHAGIPSAPGRHLLILDAAWEEGRIGEDGNGYREESRFAFPVDVGSNVVPSPGPLPTGPIAISFDTSEEGKIPQASAAFGGYRYRPLMTGYRFTIDGEVFAASDQYRDAEMVGAATILAPPGAPITFEGNQDRVLVGWGDEPLAPARSVTVQGTAGEQLVLRIRGEWGTDSFVEWELHLQIGVA
jgi:hypothetical protein